MSSRAARALTAQLQMIHEESAIGQTRQRIMEGIVEQTLLGALAVCDVLNLEDEVLRFGLASRTSETLSSTQTSCPCLWK